MKSFAHWKNITASGGVVTGLGGEHRREEMRMQTGPGHGPIQFVVDIPDEITRGEVIAKWRRLFLIDEATEEIGFDKEWPEEVRRQFESEGGKRRAWWSLE